MIGQALTGAEIDNFKVKFNDLLTADTKGAKRVWETEQTVPQEGKQWSCQIIPLDVTPCGCGLSSGSCKVCKSKVLLNIHIFPCPGGMFEKLPESYMLSDDGAIIKVSFDDWKQKHTPSNTTNTHSTKTQPKPENETSATSPVAVPSVSSQTRGSTDDQVRTKFKRNTTFCFTKHSSNWKHVHSTIVNPNIVIHPEISDLFITAKPPNYTPARETVELILSNKGLSVVLTAIDKLCTEKGFGLAVDTLWGCLKHSCTNTTPPPDHCMDILTVTESAKIVIWVVKTSLGITPADNEYSVTLARILKRRLLERLPGDKGYPRITVETYVVHSNRSVPHLMDAFKTDFRSLCLAFGNVLKDVETHFRNLILRDEDLQLTDEQTRVLLELDCNIFNVIEGAPGCGKTLIARKFCVENGEKALYICTNRALALRAAKYSINVCCCDSVAEIMQLLQNLSPSLRHLVIDDNHNYDYNEEQHHAICSQIADTGIHLHVFQDSRFHNFRYPNRNCAFGHFLLDHQDIYGSAMIKTMNKIHRNSQVTGSFLKGQISKLAPKVRVTTASSVRGDDVVIRQVSKMRLNNQENGLLHHVKSLLQDSVDPRQQHYTSRDIAILVDSKGEKDMFQNIFKEANFEVQHVIDFPVEGMIIDLVDNFIGLESRVVIYVIPTENRFRDHSQQSKYRIAIASRGVDRVDFLQEKDLDQDVIVAMQIDQYPR
jgi:hypothetical protein